MESHLQAVERRDRLKAGLQTVIHSRSIFYPNLAPVRRLTGKQEGFDELAFAAHDETGKFLEPLAVRNLRFGIQPAANKIICSGEMFR